MSQASVRMFRSDFLERFSHIPPWQPLALFAPLIIHLTWSAVVVHGIALPVFAARWVTGVATWTLVEYGLHRTLFHSRPRGRLGRRLAWIVHGVHHDWPHDDRRLLFSPALSVPIAAALWIALTMVGGAPLREPFGAGFASGYLAYDMLHYWIHRGGRGARVGRYLRHRHLTHHFQAPARNFGVSSPLWDWVFRTSVDVDLPRASE